MKNIFLSSIVMVFLLTSCNSAQTPLQIESAFPSLTFQQPVDIQNAGDGSNRLFVLEQQGIISVFQNSPGTSVKNLFLDISDKVLSGGELGLLGLAFHPDYKNNGYFFVDYTANNPRRTIISRFKVNLNDKNKADRNSELILLEISQPYSNHKGGQISFGPDGYLYISLGDGGSAGDPQNNSQNLSSFLGKILRIDVNNKNGSLNYSIPTDNPFYGNTSGYKNEIFAYGLRNVWRFSFDLTTHKLWAADVGQNAWEEIDLIEKGGNYGWRCFEGNHIYNSSGCNNTSTINPLWEYGHNSEGGYSITGGFVYRGLNVAELFGKYVYADYVSGKIWALELQGSNPKNNLLFSTSNPISTFGVDENKELYFANYATGKIYKFKGTSVTKVGKTEMPLNFELKQNFPNPFNPSTVISYWLSAFGHVTLQVYDILGNEIITLVNGNQQPGLHNLTFTVGNYSDKIQNYFVPSGIYFYRIQVNSLFNSEYSFSETKKMVLLK